MCFAPALREQALVEAIRVFWFARTVGHGFQRLGRVIGAVVVGIFVLQREAQPDVEEVGQLRVVQQAAEGRIGDDQIKAGRRDVCEIGGRALEHANFANRITGKDLLAFARNLLCQRGSLSLQCFQACGFPRIYCPFAPLNNALDAGRPVTAPKRREHTVLHNG